MIPHLLADVAALALVVAGVVVIVTMIRRPHVDEPIDAPTDEDSGERAEAEWRERHAGP